MYGQSDLTTPYSRVTSAITASDVTEQQEIDRIAELLQEAAELQSTDSIASRKLINEALEIDKTHVEALEHAVKINLRLLRYEEALYHAENITEFYPENPLGLLLRGLVQLDRHHYRDCIDSLLSCLKMKYENPKTISQLIADSVAGMVPSCNELAVNTMEMGFYAQLSEIAVALTDVKQNVMVIHLLDTAFGLNIDEPEVTVMMHLTQGHAFCGTKQYAEALLSYQSCLQLSRDNSDLTNETKALVNVAALHVRQGQTYEALITYETLIDLRDGVDLENDELKELWNPDFIKHLYINASVAYKSVSNIDRAIHYSRLCLEIIEEEQESQGLCSMHRQLGSLYETMSHYNTALKHYKSYLAMAKLSDDKTERALAYGHLGGLFSSIGLRSLSIVYHERHVSLLFGLLAMSDASSNSDTAPDLTFEDAGVIGIRRGLVTAYEMFGDSLVKRGMFDEGSNMFMNMIRYIDRSPLLRCRALYKLGCSHYAHGNSQHALHYFQQAIDICDETHTQLYRDIEFGIAECLQSQSFSGDLDRARKLYQQSLSSFQKEIDDCIHQKKFLPHVLIEKQQLAYKGIQWVLAKLGCDLECLEYAEEMKLALFRQQVCGDRLSDVFPERLSSLSLVSSVKECNSLVIYFTFLHNSLLIWALKPGVGLARFFIRKPHEVKGSTESDLEFLLKAWKESLAQHQQKYVYNLEKRHVQIPSCSTAEKDLARKEARSMSAATSLSAKSSPHPARISNEERPTPSGDEEIERALYKYLLSPLDDIISDLAPDSHVIIVPDGQLYHVPFPELRNLRGEKLYTQLQFTTLPALFLLPMVLNNKKKYEDLVADVKSQREQTYKPADAGPCSPRIIHTEDNTNSKRVGNPRLNSILTNEENESNTTRSHPYPPDIQQVSTGGHFVQVIPFTFHDFKTQKVSNCKVSHRTTGSKLKTPRGAPVPQPAYHEKTNPKPVRGSTIMEAKLRHADKLTTLITATSTGTTSLTSTTHIPEYKQISEIEKAVIIGKPHLRSRMLFGDGNVSSAGLLLSNQLKQRELDLVSGIFDVDPISGDKATRSAFMEVASKATVIHIAVDGNLREGLFLMSCEEGVTRDTEPVPERYYLISCSDIVGLNLRAKLVVFSGGWTSEYLSQSDLQLELHKLTISFIAAGAQSVIVNPHPIHEKCLLHFYKSLYSHLYEGSTISRAYTLALQDVRHDASLRFLPILLIGGNVSINIREMKRCLLDSKLDLLEKRVEQDMVSYPLNQDPSPKVLTMEDILTKMQLCYSEVTRTIDEPEKILIQLRDLAILATERLLAESLTDDDVNATRLAPPLLHSPVSVRLLKSMQFHFLPRGLTEKSLQPSVLFPSSDPYCLIPRLHTSSLSLIGLLTWPHLVKSLADLMPFFSPVLSPLIDLLLLTYHSPDIHLRVSDAAVMPLWTEPRCHSFLTLLGFQSIAKSLHWHHNRNNVRKLELSLKLLLSLSTERDEALFDHLDYSALGKPSDAARDSSPKEGAQLHTLLPVILPGKDKIVRTIPWSSRIESLAESEEKHRLALRLRDVSAKFHHEQQRLNTIQSIDLSTQAKEILSAFGETKPKPSRAKVLPGCTASRDRVETDHVRSLSPCQLNQRRKYAHFVINSRKTHLKLRQRDDLNSVISPYSRNLC